MPHKLQVEVCRIDNDRDDDRDDDRYLRYLIIWYSGPPLRLFTQSIGLRDRRPTVAATCERRIQRTRVQMFPGSCL